MPRRKREKKLGERFLMLLSVAEKKALTKAADDEGISLGEFARQAIAEKIERSKK